MNDVDSRDFGAKDLKFKEKKKKRQSKGNKSIIQPSRDSLV